MAQGAQKANRDYWNSLVNIDGSATVYPPPCQRYEWEEDDDEWQYDTEFGRRFRTYVLCNSQLVEVLCQWSYVGSKAVWGFKERVYLYKWIGHEKATESLIYDILKSKRVRGVRKSIRNLRLKFRTSKLEPWLPAGGKIGFGISHADALMAVQWLIEFESAAVRDAPRRFKRGDYLVC